jgi:hypothetical protein
VLHAAAHHPGRAEAVDQHAELPGPERLCIGMRTSPLRGDGKDETQEIVVFLQSRYESKNAHLGMVFPRALAQSPSFPCFHPRHCCNL